MATCNIEKYFVEEEPQCSVTMDGHTIQSGDFVAVLAKDDGDHRISYNTDAITLGLAIKMIAVEFCRQYEALTPEEQDMVTAELGEAFTTTTTGITVEEETTH